jgi:hypothetical protein
LSSPSGAPSSPGGMGHSTLKKVMVPHVQYCAKIR